MKKGEINFKAIAYVLLVIIIVFIILNLIKIPISDRNISTELKPYVVLDYYTAQEKAVNDGNCVARNFSYSYSWGGWYNEDEDFTTPYLEIINYENQSGTYIVQFAFFDENEYPYVLYKENIKWEDASIYSDEKNVLLKPNGRNMVSIPTPKPKIDTTYWAIGDIKAPVLYDCGENVEYKTVVKNRTVTEYQEIEKVDTVVKKISIWNYLFGS